MIELLFSSPKLLGALGVVVAFIASIATAFLKGRSAGKQGEQAKQAQAERRAAEERSKMQQEGSAAEQHAASLSDAEAREEALKWARKSSQ